MDEEFDFVIPLQKEDLQNPANGQYSVSEVFNLNESLSKIKDLQKCISKRGCVVILDYFDPLYSVYCDDDIGFLSLQQVYDMVLEKLLFLLKDYAKKAVKFETSHEKRTAANIVKMIIYIFSSFVKTYEGKLSADAETNLVDPRRRKNVKKSKKIEDLWDWGEKKKSAFSALFSILDTNISVLWPSGVAEASFVNLIANCCYKAYENPDITLAKMKPLKDSIAHVLSLLVQKYNHVVTFIPKIVQLMKHHEHTASAVSGLVVIMFNEYKITTIVSKILAELTQEIACGDSSGLDKATSTLIIELAEQDSTMLISSCDTLIRNLVLEPYSVRNASLLAFSEIIIYMHINKKQSQEDIKLRKELFNFLLNHILDQNSYVRSKVLQLWVKLTSEHAVPIKMLLKAMNKAKNRLKDKSAHTVKNAILFFATALKNNPCSGKFDVEEIKSKLIKENDEMVALEAKRTISQEEAWIEMKPSLILALTNHIEAENQKKENAPEGENEESMDQDDQQNFLSVENVITLISKLMISKNYVEAYDLLKLSEIQYPNANELRCNAESLGTVDKYCTTLKKIFFSCVNRKPDEEDNHLADDYEKQCSIIAYTERTLEFATLITDATTSIEKVLNGKSSIEVLEAIEFFTIAFQFGIPEAKRIIRSVLTLMKCGLPTVKDAVAEAYKTLYLDSSQTTERGWALHVSSRLIKLVKQLDTCQKSSLGDLIEQWMKNNVFNRCFTKVLWEKFISKENVKEEDKVASLIILDLMARTNNSIVLSNLQVLISYGLKDNLKKTNLSVVEQTCNMISKYGVTKIDGKFVRLSPNHEIFTLAVKCLDDNFNVYPSKGYIPMSYAVINMIFKLCIEPHLVTDKIVSSLYKKLTENESDTSMADMSDSNLNVSITSSVPATDKPDKLEETELFNKSNLKRIFLIYSDIAFRKYNYMDKDLMGAFKKKLAAAQMDKDENETEEDALYKNDYEECQTENLVTYTNIACENMLEDTTTLDFYLKRILFNVCQHFNRVTMTKTLLSAAAIALSKLMMISLNFCKEKIQIFVTIMTKSRYRIVRQNLILAFGDLLVRFPNVIEPWSPHVYGMLKDNSAPVRKKTVIVLTHLITREMIKVRGHLSEICLCLEDEDPTISEIVHSLIIDLSQKGNALYNVIPDLISKLSVRTEPIDYEFFCRIIKFVLKLIGKDRQNELLIEKLCTRIKETDNERQLKDLSFCLLQLNCNERGLRKICDILPQLKERFVVKEVYDSILTIFNTANKSINKPQLKEIAAEGLESLDEITSMLEIPERKKKSSTNEDDEDINEVDDTFQSPTRSIPPSTSKSIPPSTSKSRSNLKRSARKPRK